MDEVSYGRLPITSKLADEVDWKRDKILQHRAEIKDGILSSSDTNDCDMFKADSYGTTGFAVDGQILLRFRDIRINDLYDNLAKGLLH